MIQVTLVSLYGEKDGELKDLKEFIEFCQREMEGALGGAFKPYKREQIHATIVGLERRIGSALHNLNFLARDHQPREVQMDFDGLLKFLRGSSHVPFKAQIAGFKARDYPFVSDPFEKGEIDRPYDRSFSIQGDKAVVMGWPLRGRPWSATPKLPWEFVQEGRIYPPTLDEIRHAAQKYGVLHSYHKTNTAVDNDLFFRIGLLDPKPDDQTIQAITTDVREKLANRDPVILEITLDKLYVAAYEDNRLPLENTRVWSLADSRVTGQFIADLYR